jgi:AmmeMemoRadiSam system protein A
MPRSPRDQHRVPHASVPASGRFDPESGGRLVRLAVGSLGAHLRGRPYRIEPPGSVTLGRPGACFVTLEVREQLRGCVGTVRPHRPLWRDAIRNAVGAAADPRLPRVTRDEWPTLDVTVAVLSRPERIGAADRAALTALLRPGIDGLILADHGRRSTFLPVVWAKLADPDRFVAALLAKGGWVPDGWPPGMAAYRYTTTQFTDRAPRSPLPA